MPDHHPPATALAGFRGANDTSLPTDVRYRRDDHRRQVTVTDPTQATINADPARAGAGRSQPTRRWHHGIAAPAVAPLPARPTMGRRNCATALRRRPGAEGMREFDALPADLRRWLAGAVLPWSTASVRRVWARALRASGGDAAVARDALEAAERRRLARDVAQVWGPSHPFLTPPPGTGNA